MGVLIKPGVDGILVDLSILLIGDGIGETNQILKIHTLLTTADSAHRSITRTANY